LLALRRLDRDVLNAPAGRTANALDKVHPLPARALPRKRRDNDLVGRVVLERILDAGQGIGLHDLTLDLEARLAQFLDRSIEPVLRGRLRLGALAALRRDDREPVWRLGCASLEGLDQRPLPDGLVRHDKGVLDGLRLEVDDDVLYRFHVDNDQDGEAEDRVYEFRFKTENRPALGQLSFPLPYVGNPNIPVAELQGITKLDGPGSEGLTRRQSYTVTEVSGKKRTQLFAGRQLIAVPSNAGPATFKNYEDLASQGI